MGELVPIMALECVPGDKFSISAESLLRFQPLLSPVMHRMDVYIHYFFVPNRLIWKNWEKFITNTPVGGNIPAFPTVDIGPGNWSRLCDFFGIPDPTAPGATGLETISAMPFAAYQRIFNEYYRDQNLRPEIDGTDLLDGDNTTQFEIFLNEIRNRAWEHDYFTAALPFAQKGPAMDIPLGDVTLKDDWQPDSMPFFTHDEAGTFAVGDVTQVSSGPSDPRIQINGISPNAYDPDGSLEVSATTINDLRRAFRLQEWLEKNARGGTRYTENIYAHFGVKSSDQRMQRPEYITGTKSPVVISEVLNTTGTDDLPQGNMAGHAVSVTSGKSGRYFCEEHGYIIGIMSILPKTAYQQGLEKHWLKFDPLDFYWPDFAHLGEQPVQNREVFAFQAAGADTFGYVPRYAEYKFMQNRVAGDMRDTLDFWHMGRIFATPPALNAEFVEANPTERIFAVEDPGVDKLICHVYNKIRALRPMPKFGTPTF